MNFTQNEISFLKACVNYTTVKAQLSDNYSNAGMEEATKIFKGNKHAGAGLISSLTQKGCGYMDEEDDIFWLTDDLEIMEKIFEEIEVIT